MNGANNLNRADANDDLENFRKSAARVFYELAARSSHLKSLIVRVLNEGCACHDVAEAAHDMAGVVGFIADLAALRCGTAFGIEHDVDSGKSGAWFLTQDDVDALAGLCVGTNAPRSDHS